MVKKLEAIIRETIDIRSIVKAIHAEGYVIPVRHQSKIVKFSKDLNFLELMFSPKRIEKLSDGWFRDYFLSRIYGKDFNWSPASLEKHIPWEEGEEYSKQFGMQPSDFELSTLIDRYKYNPAIIDVAKILGLKTDNYYWSRTPTASLPVSAWIVHFKYGYVSDHGKDDDKYVRPVRLSQ